ncbi:MAG: hypothetical protein ACE5JU_09650 [Candidatus Binatia bacterium]
MRIAEPIDRAVCSNKSDRVKIAYDPVVFYGQVDYSLIPSLLLLLLAQGLLDWTQKLLAGGKIVPKNPDLTGMLLLLKYAE